jgi:hypothetical protein
MAMSAIATAIQTASQQAMQSLTSHKHKAHGFGSNSDIDTAGSSVATAPSPTGKTGSKVNITV